VPDKQPNPTEPSLDFEYILKELDSLRAGVSLLGLLQCSCCHKYFHCSDGKNLLNIGQLVCYRCLERWWQQRSPALSIEQRTNVERQILRWLVAYHEATVVRDTKQMPGADEIELKIVVGCEQCAGQGKRGERVCQNCNGRGANWVLVLKQQMT
jgi:hypothetical protein